MNKNKYKSTEVQVHGMNNEGHMQLQVPPDLLPDAQGTSMLTELYKYKHKHKYICIDDKLN